MTAATYNQCLSSTPEIAFAQQIAFGPLALDMVATGCGLLCVRVHAKPAVAHEGLRLKILASLELPVKIVIQLLPF